MKFFVIIFILSLANSLDQGTNQRHFFRKITKDSGVENNAPEEPIINPQFFKCGRKDSCTHVVMFKDTKTYQIVHGEAELKGIKRPIIVWEKESILQPKQAKVCSPETKPPDGWIVFQRRVDASVDFNRNWTDYKSGFGDPCGSFWIGLDKLHCLAGPGKGAVLNITMKHGSDPNKLFYAAYSVFEIGNEADGYRLKISGYSGNAGDSFGGHSGMKFSTNDRDNDIWESTNCASNKGGWWYHSCYTANLNNNGAYMYWRAISQNHGNFIMSEMRVKSLTENSSC